jgi:hypothetical protein
MIVFFNGSVDDSFQNFDLFFGIPDMFQYPKIRKYGFISSTDQALAAIRF